jgi:hypothetical protein
MYRPSEWSIQSGFPIKILCAFFISLMSSICHGFPIFLYLITLQYLVKNTDYEASHYAVFSTVQLLHPSNFKYFPQFPWSQTPPVSVLPLTYAIRFHTHKNKRVKLNFSSLKDTFLDNREKTKFLNYTMDAFPDLLVFNGIKIIVLRCHSS